MHRGSAFLVCAGTCSQREKARHALHERARHLQLPRLERRAERSHRRPQAPIRHRQRLTAQQQPRALDGAGFGCAAEQRKSVFVRERKAQRAGATVLNDGTQLRRAVASKRSRNRGADVAGAVHLPPGARCRLGRRNISAHACHRRKATVQLGSDGMQRARGRLTPRAEEHSRLDLLWRALQPHACGMLPDAAHPVGALHQQALLIVSAGGAADACDGAIVFAADAAAAALAVAVIRDAERSHVIFVALTLVALLKLRGQRAGSAKLLVDAPCAAILACVAAVRCAAPKPCSSAAHLASPQAARARPAPWPGVR